MAPVGGLNFSRDDALWTESYWPSDLYVALYQAEESTTGPLAAGLIATFVWGLLYYFGRGWWSL